MKHKGSKSDFITERNRCLFRTINECKHRASFIYMPRIMEEAVKSHCPRFWVSEERAAIVISSMRRNGLGVLDTMIPTRRAMYSELWLRVRTYLRCNKGSDITEAVLACVNSPAPEFYLTVQSASRIYSNMRNDERARRRR